ncbi:MAG TPA: hypothetical protein VGT79_10145, partial [Xanthomonadaceae bacterium]|nr:hypothetical protein [Xanthomonadaceae bacterium]
MPCLILFSVRLEILAYASGKKFLSSGASGRKGSVYRAMQESDHAAIQTAFSTKWVEDPVEASP